MNSLISLPTELLYAILFNLPLTELLNLRLTCRVFHELLESSWFWTKKSQIEFSLPSFITSPGEPVRWFSQLLKIFTSDSPVIMACRLGEMSILPYLIETHPDQTREFQSSLLITAAESGKISVLEYLFDRYIDDEKIWSSTIRDVVYLAAENGQTMMVDYLAKYQSDVDYTLVYFRAYRLGHVGVMRYLLSNSVKFHLDLEEILMEAVRDDNYDIIGIILEYTSPQIYLYDLLETAVYNDSQKILPILIDLYPGQRPHKINEIVQLALDLDRKSIVRELIDYADLPSLIIDNLNLEYYYAAKYLLRYGNMRDLLRYSIEEEEVKLMKFICEEGFPSASLVSETYRWCRDRKYYQAAQYLKDQFQLI